MISTGKRKLASLMSAVMVVALAGPSFAAEGAKGLFFEQLDKPEKSLNTGVQYWIDLRRDGRQLKVTNKFNFKSGDRIKFHVKSNINGYAYILLKSGSRGEQSVLFPDKAVNDNNKVASGKEYILPERGYLTFDDNPGLEKVSLVLSRMPIDAKAYLDKGSESAPTLIASAMTGSKDLIPQRVLVHYPKQTTVAVKPAATTSHKPASSDKKAPKVAEKKTKIVKSTPIRTTETEKVAKVASKPAPRDDDGVTTVVSKVPGNILHVEVDLQHL